MGEKFSLLSWDVMYNNNLLTVAVVTDYFLLTKCKLDL